MSTIKHTTMNEIRITMIYEDRQDARNIGLAYRTCVGEHGREESGPIDDEADLDRALSGAALDPASEFTRASALQYLAERK